MCPHLLGRRVQQHVAVLGRRSACTPRLEEILHAYADLALDAADRLLQHAGEDRVRRLHLHRVLKLLVEVEQLTLLLLMYPYGVPVQAGGRAFGSCSAGIFFGGDAKKT